MLVGITVFGIENHFDYLKALSYLSKHGESFHHNQSMNGLLNRFFSISSPELYNNLSWKDLYQAFPPYNSLVYFGTVVSSILIMASCLIFRPVQSQDVLLVDFCLMSLGLTVASPIVWIYHYSILLPISAVILSFFHFKLNETRATKILYRVFASCFLLTSVSIPFVEYVSHTRFNFLQSYYYISAIGIFIVLYRLRRIMSDSSQILSLKQS